MFEKAKERYKNTEYKLVIAKVIDKYNFCRAKNKIMYTDFLNVSERTIIDKVLKEEKITNYVFYSGKEEADRMVLIFYPEKITMEMLEKNYRSILKVISINLPQDLKYEHRDFLSGIMKLGIKREKFRRHHNYRLWSRYYSFRRNFKYFSKWFKNTNKI